MSNPEDAEAFREFEEAERRRRELAREADEEDGGEAEVSGELGCTGDTGPHLSSNQGDGREAGSSAGTGGGWSSPGGRATES